MLTITFTGLLVMGVLAGLTLYGYKNRTLSLVLTVVITALVSVFGLGTGAAYHIGLSAAQTGAVSGYHQFLNGSLVSADVNVTHCDRDGSCVHEDNYCDSYTDIETETYTDANGKTQTRTKLVTKYHSCPQMTEEYTYTVADNFGNRYTIANHIFAENPTQWRSKGVDMSGSGSVPRGVPPRWQQFKTDIDAGDADPVTVPNTYSNYVLGSEATILKASSQDIKQLQKAKLLPLHTANMNKDPIHDDFNADKVSFVGMSAPANAATWQQALMRFNAALGMRLQGDMHLVVLKASSLPSNISEESYLNALKAYWLNDLGKNALAKNGIMLVLGLDETGAKIQWAKAATGMPVGNNEMVQGLQNELEGVSFDPDKLFGNTKASIVESNGKKKPTYTIGEGIIPQVVMVDFPFKRACMGCKSAEDKGQQGFIYLQTEIPLAGSDLVITDVLYVVTIVVLWGVVLFWAYPRLSLNEPFEQRSTSNTGYRRNTSFSSVNW